MRALTREKSFDIWNGPSEDIFVQLEVRMGLNFMSLREIRSDLE